MLDHGRDHDAGADRTCVTCYVAAMSDLFTALEPELPAAPRRDADRPLADRLRPTSLADLVGQEQLLRPDAPLARMLERRRLASLILWGPPGCGKTTLARLHGPGGGRAVDGALGRPGRRRRPAQELRGG